MNRIIDEVVDSIVKSGLVEVEVSARHVHLTQEQIEILFGEGAQLHPKRMLSQPGQFLSEEKVKLVGKKGPVRESGNLEGAGTITIEGPKGVLKDIPAAIVAHNHIHVPTDIARKMNMKDGERVSVQMLTERMLTFDDVVIRVSDKYRYKMHIDFDEANAAMVSGFTLGKIIRH